jgi:ABC-2 type transport system permease protein
MSGSVAQMWQIVSTTRWLAGPILDKELRVASRQRKYYLLRFAYVGLLTLVTMQFWYIVTAAGGGASGVVQVSRLGQAGKTIIATIVWFQFLTGQILAAVLLSDAISSEIRRRTLEDLLVTPLRATHIVLGKLLSRLVQLVLLLAISLPVLALVRVFGGVPWDYVVSGLCITLTGSIFAGSLSLLCSITNRHAHQAVLAVVVWYLVVWGILAWVLMGLARTGLFSSVPVAFVLSLTNPFLALLGRTTAMIVGPSGATTMAPPLLHCLTILALAGAVLALSVWRVRRAALVGPAGARREAKARDRRGAGARRRKTSQAIRRVKGAPVVWKESCTSRLQARRQILFHGVLWVAVAGFILVMAAFFGPQMYGSFFIPIAILQLLFVIRLGVAAAGAVVREREARTWPILLTTPLSDEEIVKGKVIAALRRNLPLLIPLLAFYLLVFVFGRSGARDLLGFALSMGLLVISLTGTVVFLLGSGLYFSVRLKTTAAAVASTFVAYLVPNFFCPGAITPVFLMFVTMHGAAGESNRAEALSVFAITMLIPSAVYAIVGLLLARRTIRRLRKDVFR